MEKIEEVFTVKETAQILKVDVHKIYDLIKAGLLPALKLGSLKVRGSSINKFLNDYDGMDLTDLYNIKKLEI